MTRELNSADLEAVFAHGAWLRRLAGHLVSGSDGAEDLVQETWMAALRARPDNPARLRAWLAQVMRNALRRRLRDDRRRRAREEEATSLADSTAEPASAAMERLQLQRQLAEMVAGLDEPFAATLVMRYFEGRSAADIARSMGVPEGTVRWRTKEGLDRLRRQLDDRHGGNRKGWVALLGPIARERPPVPSPALGAPPMLLAGALGALVLVIGAVVAGVHLARWWAKPRSTIAASGAFNDEGPPSATAPGVPGPSGNGVLTGLVRTEVGQPVAGALVAVRQPGPRVRMDFSVARVRLAATATTGADGRFRLLGLPSAELAVSATHPAHATGFVLGVDTSGARAATCEIVLPRPRFALSGQVADSGGGPIAGAHVLALGPSGSVFVVASDARGRYRLPLAAPVHNLLVEAAGYAPGAAFLRVDADLSRDFALEPPARVAGTVVTAADRTPVAGAEVRLLPTDFAGPDRWEESTTTDDEGGFAIGGLPAGDFRIVVRKAALVTPGPVPFHPSPGGAQQVELALVPGVAVQGRLATPDGRGVPDATVHLMDTGMPGVRAPFHAADTDAGGRFRLEGVAPGEYRLGVAARGFDGRERVVQIPPTSVFELSIQADPVAFVSGVVRTSQGSAAVGARLAGDTRPRDDGSGRRSFARADPDGRFELGHLGAGDLTISARLDREVGFLGPVPVTPGERKEVAISLAAGSFVSGVVRWEDGTPAPGVRVHARPRPARGERFAYDLTGDPVRTDREGRFEAGPFHRNDVNLVVENQNQRVTFGRRNTPGERMVSVDAGQRLTGVELVATSGRHRLAGLVLDASGRPLAGATLIAAPEGAFKESAQARRTTTTGDGSFSIDGLAPGAHAVWALHPEHAELHIPSVPTSSNDLRLRFGRPVRLTGTVVTRSGKPVADYFVVVIPVAPPGVETVDQRSRREGSWDNPRLEIHDARGRFEVARLAPGRYDITANAPDGLLALARDVLLAEGEDRRLTLVAEPGVLLTGRVVEAATGAPVPEARVSTLLPGIRGHNATTDATGAFRLAGVPPGPEVTVSVAGVKDVHQPRRVAVSVPTLGAAVDLGTIRLERLPPAAR